MPKRAAARHAPLLRAVLLCAIGSAISGFAPAPAAEAADWKMRLPRGAVLASYYGDRFHGQPTASGETFDKNELTAAHPWLPFGTLLRVINVDNGREAIVRVNDRGPFHAERGLDVSKAAARKLGMIGAGIADVVVVLADPRKLGR